MLKLALPFFISLFTIQASAQAPLKYIDAKNSWNGDSLGNHRVVVLVKSKTDVAHVNIVWRRRDANPQLKNVIVIAAKTGQKINHVSLKKIGRENGTVFFEPVAGPGRYYIYYMPYRQEGSTFYPKVKYLPIEKTTNKEWAAKTAKTPVNAVVESIEPVNDFNRFGPMEIIATAQETKNLVAKNAKSDYLVFPEDRMHPIKMTTDLPQRWIKTGPKKTLLDTALRAENFAYQLGVYALNKDLKNVRIVFSDLRSGGAIIQKSAIQCINNSGINWLGQPEKFIVNVPKKKVQAMWCTVNIPENAKPGTYKGTAVVTAENAKPQTINLLLKVGAEMSIDHGVNEPWKQTRLTWLNSTLAEKNTVLPPYTPLRVSGNEISLLGRKVQLAATGFPAQIQSFFTQEMTSLSVKPQNVLTEPIHFHFMDEAGKEIKLNPSDLSFTQKSEGTTVWKAQNTSAQLKMDVTGSLEFDGFIYYTVKVTALEPLKLQNTKLHIPLKPEIARYIMGLGYTGQKRPDSVAWKWNVATKNQDGAWLGTINAGLQLSLRDDHYVRPLNTNFYLKKPLLLPTSWGNENKGGIHISQKGKAFLVDAFSGGRTLQKGDTLAFNFRLLITPFHPIDTKSHFANRYIHKYIPIDSAKKFGASVINIHQGTPINPYINYPFIKTKEMKAYIDSAHRSGLKVKIYNTVRELSNRSYELPALFSLGDEVFSKGDGGGYSWLQEHLDQRYIAAWYSPQANDAAILNSGMSRWHNYYIEGMNWLTKNQSIDGIYLDDVAFDRNIMKRVKRVLTQDKHAGLIDLHSANQYNKSDGFINSTMLYMDLFPYLNRLWFGEEFDYEANSPDYYLTEMSGLPFGLMGEMLQNDGNPWRGMLYGMTNRLLWSKKADPRPLWKIWDSFGIGEAKMIGYWVDNNPIKSNLAEVPVTIYKKNGSVLISLASWAKTPINVQLKIDWKSLGIDPAKATISAPSIPDFQEQKNFKLNEAIPVQPNKGWLLLIKQK